MIWNLHIFQNDHKSKCLLLHIVVKSVFFLFSWLLRFTIVSMLYIISPGLKLHNWKLVPFNHLHILNAYTSRNHRSVTSSLYKFDGSFFFFLKIPHRREVIVFDLSHLALCSQTQPRWDKWQDIFPPRGWREFHSIQSWPLNDTELGAWIPMYNFVVGVSMCSLASSHNHIMP